MRAAALSALAAAVFLAAVLATPAKAAFPGKNGKIAFASNRDGDAEIYLMTAGGGSVRQLTFTGAGIDDSGPVFSPTGRQIIFHRTTGGGDSEIFIMKADGSNPRQLTTNNVADQDPAFTPDGRQIVFASDRGGAGHGDRHHERERGQSAPAHLQLRHRCRSGGLPGRPHDPLRVR